MASTKTILVSLHGRLCGVSVDSHLVVKGRTAVTQNDTGLSRLKQGAPGALDATGTLTAALLNKVIVTSTTAAAVTATLDTGTAMDTAFSNDYGIGEGFSWSAIATGANAFTVTASSGHTIVGSGVVATGTSKQFFSRRTAANTWVTYNLS